MGWAARQQLTGRSEQRDDLQRHSSVLFGQAAVHQVILSAWRDPVDQRTSLIESCHTPGGRPQLSRCTAGTAQPQLGHLERGQRS